MNSSRLALITIAIALFTFGCNKTDQGSTVPANVPSPAAPAATATPDEFAGARANYAKNCLNCHGAKGEGGTVEIEGKKLKVPALATGHALNHSDSDFVKQISKGGDGMPAFAGRISASEIDELVRFIRHDLQGGVVKSDARSDLKMDEGTGTKTGDKTGAKKVAPIVK